MLNSNLVKMIADILFQVPAVEDNSNSTIIEIQYSFFVNHDHITRKVQLPYVFINNVNKMATLEILRELSMAEMTELLTGMNINVGHGVIHHFVDLQPSNVNRT